MVIVAVPVVLVFTNEAPVAERFVVEAFAIVASVAVVVASVVVPVTVSSDAVVVAKVVVPVKVFHPANVCVEVDMKPRAVNDASGILNVWVSPAVTMLKSVPVVPTAKNWIESELPLIEFTPPVAEPVSIKITSPFALTESATPLKVDVAEF